MTESSTKSSPYLAAANSAIRPTSTGSSASSTSSATAKQQQQPQPAPPPATNAWSPGAIGSTAGGPNVRRAQSRHFDAFGGGQQQAPVPPAQHHYTYFDDSSWAGQVNKMSTSPLLNQPKPATTTSPSGMTVAPVPAVNPWLENRQPASRQASISSTVSEKKSTSSNNSADEELIPTAIVIKNIPFAIKKEQLLDVMTSLGLPLPYAFNYHFDNGVFRGLAFANFTTPEETATVINNLNGKEIGGRKLRVEYKKMLPLAERERIEREKRERRGQLEEQHRGPPNGGNNGGNSNSNNSNKATGHHHSSSGNNSHHHHSNNGHIQQQQQQQQQQQNGGGAPTAIPTPAAAPAGGGASAKVDLNDPETLEFYSQLLLFKDDRTRFDFMFPAGLNQNQRRTVLLLCNQLGLVFVGQDKASGGILISKQQAPPPPPPALSSGGASTASAPPPPPPGLFESTGQPLYHPQPQHHPPQQLRGTKSFADIRAHGLNYPYQISAPGTPTGSPFFPSHTPPPTGNTASSANANSTIAPLTWSLQQQRSGNGGFPQQQPQHHHHQHSQFLNNVFADSGNTNSSINSLNDSFASLMSLGGTPLSRVPSSMNSNSATAPSNASSTSPVSLQDAGVIGSHSHSKSSGGSGVVDVNNDDD